jgi:transcriptional regulator with XRE-family HTH domain
MKFAQILRRRRKELRLTQREIAETLGIRDVNVSDWENGRGMPEASRLPALARRLEMSVSELMGDMRPAMSGKAAAVPVKDQPVASGEARSAPQLQWVSEDEARLLSNYRTADARDQQLIQEAAEEARSTSGRGWPEQASSPPLRVEAMAERKAE